MRRGRVYFGDFKKGAREQRGGKQHINEMGYRGGEQLNGLGIFH
jgi:hypothetical protein